MFKYDFKVRFKKLFDRNRLKIIVYRYDKVVYGDVWIILNLWIWLKHWLKSNKKSNGMHLNNIKFNWLYDFYIVLLINRFYFFIILLFFIIILLFSVSISHTFLICIYSFCSLLLAIYLSQSFIYYSISFYLISFYLLVHLMNFL